MIKKIDHIGIAVKNMEETLKIYHRVYGLEPIKIEIHEDLKIKIAFLRIGEVLIELLEATEPGAGRIGKFINENGEGFHHIALRVKSINRAIDRLKNMNVPLKDQVPRNGGDGSMIAFINSEFTQNVLTELVERKREVVGS